MKTQCNGLTTRVIFSCLALLSPLANAAAAVPVDLSAKSSEAGATAYANAAVTLPDGTLETYYRRALGGKISIFRQKSADDGATWSKPEVLTDLTLEPWGGPMPLLDQQGELHFVLPKARGKGRKPAIDRFIDLYHMRSTHGRTQWTQPQLIYEGYCGSLQGVYQMRNGRILVPFADWLPGVPTTPPTGPEVVTCVYSDDQGQTWKRSPSKLTSPCHEGYNGANYGACEPTLVELQDGRMWMLIRTQDDYLYESFSADGETWSPAQRSRFHSSNSPAFQIRLKDGRLVVFWNNTEAGPRLGKDGVYAGRDALHAAISSDDGKTWYGFREVYRDSIRNASPPKDGDRGTAYPHACLTKEGKKIVLVSGQGAERRRRFLIDPEWLLETRQNEDFADLDKWHLYKGFGPAVRWWRDRVQGPVLKSHPDAAGKNALHVRRPDERDADGAVWNFPAAVKGELILRLRLEKGGQGARISLADFMLDPCDDTAVEKSAYSLLIGGDGRGDSGAIMEPGRWHTLSLRWGIQSCTVSVDGRQVGEIAARVKVTDGLSYLRLRSTASAKDEHGFLVEFVVMEVK